MSSTLSEVQGFKVVGIRYNKECKGIHQLLWKQHTVRIQSQNKPPDRTLFVLNVPPYCTEESFKRIFSQYGKVRSVYFHKRPTSGLPPTSKYKLFAPCSPIRGFKVAYVVFNNPSSIKNAMSVPTDTVLEVSTKENKVLTGVMKWQQQYNENLVRKEALSEEIKLVMDEYDKRCEEEKAAGKEEPDEEGWVTVKSQKKKPQLEKVNELNLKKKKKKKRKQELVNFYSFQNRQVKIDHLAQLRKKFEEDKKRISVMRAARKFRPY